MNDIGPPSNVWLRVLYTGPLALAVIVSADSSPTIFDRIPKFKHSKEVMMPWQYFLGMIVMGLQAAVKNPAAIAREKEILLHIRDQINLLFPGEK